MPITMVLAARDVAMPSTMKVIKPDADDGRPDDYSYEYEEVWTSSWAMDSTFLKIGSCIGAIAFTARESCTDRLPRLMFELWQG